MSDQSNEKAPLLDPCGNTPDQLPAITGHFKSARQLEERVTPDEFSRAVNALGAAKTDTVTGDPEFLLLLEEEEAKEKAAILRLLEEEEAKEKAAKFRHAWKRGFSSGVEAEAHIVTSGGRVVPTHVVRGFSKPKALFDDVNEEYEDGFYPTLELTNGSHVRVGEFCHTLEESEGVITLILAEVRRKAATY